MIKKRTIAVLLPTLLYFFFNINDKNSKKQKSFSKSPLKTNTQKSTYNLLKLMPRQIPGMEDHFRRLKRAKLITEDKKYLYNHPSSHCKIFYEGI